MPAQDKPGTSTKQEGLHFPLSSSFVTRIEKRKHNSLKQSWLNVIVKQTRDQIGNGAPLTPNVF
jgi:hypothetical protein